MSDWKTDFYGSVAFIVTVRDRCFQSPPLVSVSIVGIESGKCIVGVLIGRSFWDRRSCDACHVQGD